MARKHKNLMLKEWERRSPQHLDHMVFQTSFKD